MRKGVTIKVISFLEKLSNDYIAGGKQWEAQGKINFKQAERLIKLIKKK